MILSLAEYTYQKKFLHFQVQSGVIIVIVRINQMWSGFKQDRVMRSSGQGQLRSEITIAASFTSLMSHEGQTYL